MTTHADDARRAIDRLANENEGLRNELWHAQEALRVAQIRLRLMGKINVQKPTVAKAFDSYRNIVQVTEKDGRIARAVIDALKYVQSDIEEEWNRGRR